jgi:hypothetical protein
MGQRQWMTGILAISYQRLTISHGHVGAFSVTPHQSMMKLA